MTVSSLSNLQKRIVSASVLIPVVFFVLWMGAPYTTFLLGLIGIGCLVEWTRLVIGARPDVKRRFFWLVIGFSYIIPAFVGIHYLMGDRLSFVSILIFIWASDGGAYFIGRTLKGPKMAPTISPGKTWSGAVGGLITAVFAGFLFGFVLHKTNPAIFVAGYMVEAFNVSLIAQIGDLLESLAKRHLGVKDSGSLIPGHGGLLDRLDSLLAIGILAYFLYGM